MTSEPLTIRTLRDFLDIPQEQLATCLRAFRSAIESHKLSGAPAPGAAAVFDTFVWTPPATPRLRAAAAQSPDVTLAELGVRPLARVRLRSIHIYTLGDCAEATAEELLRLPDVGSHTVARIQEHLASVGLAFKRSAGEPAPAAVAPEPATGAARSLRDESPIADLGIKRRTITRLLRRDVDTVGKLRRQSMRRLWSILGMESIRDVVAALRHAGLDLEDGGDEPPPVVNAPRQHEASRQAA